MKRFDKETNNTVFYDMVTVDLVVHIICLLVILLLIYKGIQSSIDPSLEKMFHIN